MPDDLPVALLDASDFAAAGYLARYREPTTSAYRQDLRCYWQWCADHQLVPLAAKRPHLELYLRDLEQRGYAPATVSRRLSTVAGLFKYAVIDELVATNPTLAVRRPHVRWEGQRRTVLHPLEFAAVLSAARQHSATAHALVALLGMLGLRISETCNAQITDLHDVGGYEVLHVLGKGAKPAEIPLPIPVLRAVRAATDGRTTGPVLVSVKGQALTRGAASRLLQRVVRQAGISHDVSPHTLRRTFCTAGLISGVPLRDMQYAMATPTRAPPSATTWPAPTSTGTPPIASPPTSPAWPSVDPTGLMPARDIAAERWERTLKPRSGCPRGRALAGGRRVDHRYGACIWCPAPWNRSCALGR